MTDNVNEMNRQMQKLQRFQQSHEIDKQIEAIQQLYEKLASSAISYTNLILAAGYGGYLAFWATVSGKVPAWLFSLTGFLILTSLTLFIGWEISKMVWGAIHMRRIDKLLQGQKGPHIVAQYQAAYASNQQRTGTVWIFFLIPTVLTGLGAAFTLIGFFALSLWKLTFS
ncbi:hypothetical protein [Pseudomonas sp. OTU5201]|uniref:hypothetical protein n=1 Tax=Pseudomonas sp. OTU5201 TaxID=3043850 RepID=UPI00313C4220